SSPHLAVFLNNTPLPTPAIRSLTLDSTSVIGGCGTAIGTVTLAAPAPTQGALGGAVVILASSNPAAIVPAEVLIPAGTLQVRFPVATTPTAAPQWASISASYLGTAKRAALVVRPIGPAAIASTPSLAIRRQTARGKCE